MNEDDVVREIGIWIQNSCPKVTILQDKDDYYSKFTVKGTHGKKPDLVVINCENTAIEVKTGDKGSVVSNRSGIVDYFEDYCEGRARYLDNNGYPLKIDNFVIATRYSQLGRLLKNEVIREDRKDSNRLWAAKNNYIPLHEYTQTLNKIRDGTIDCLECNDRRRMTKEMWALAIAHEKGEQYE
jgi:hypothetical protein